MSTIVCLGDSITFGDGDSRSIGWVGRLNAFLQERKPHIDWVYNLGIPGDTTVGTYYRYCSEVLPRLPDLVLIAVGTNDSKRSGTTGPQDLRSDLARTMAQWQTWEKHLKSGLHKTVILGTLPSDESCMPYNNPGKPQTWVLQKDLKEYNDALKDFCQKAGLPFIDFWPHWTDDMTKTHFRDGLHPNDTGYDWMFGLIKDFLLSHKLI